MNITEELRKLADLRKEGHLTEQEFSEAKRQLLAQEERESARDFPAERADDNFPAGDSFSEKTYQSSRWSAGNLFFPDSVRLGSDGILFRKRSLLGSNEEHINYKAVASVRITNGIFLANIMVETSGGSQPIFINGLWKAEAREIQDTIRALQKNT